MQEPIDVLGSHPSGALTRRLDPRDYRYSPLEIAEASAPFVWPTGNGPDPELVSLLTIKNQGPSDSCGGQAFSFYGQRLRAAYGKDARQRSAKYLYSQVYAPGGGSSDRDLANIAIKQGFGLESDTTSYQNGQAPTEAFMERPQDITSKARIDAARDQAQFAYAFPTIDIDSIGQAASTCLGLVFGIEGANNGTWLSAEPKPPTGSPDWRHYMYGAHPQIFNGRKGIWCTQSWGTSAGLNGWQFLDESYFASGHIWSAIVLIYNPVPTQPPHFSFDADLKFGQSGPDITALQQYLAYDGDFNLTPTGYFGAITAQAVLRFQIKYNVAAVATLEELGGDVVGPATRNKLNNLLQ